jgi:WD40 repeat protein
MSGPAFLGFGPRAELLAGVEENERRLKVWDVSQGVLAATLPTGGRGTHAAFSPDGRRLAVSTDAGVRFFDLPARVGGPVAVTPEHQVWSFGASADHSVLTALARDGTSSAPAAYRWALPPDGPAVLVSRRPTEDGTPHPVHAVSPDGQSCAFAGSWGGRDPTLDVVERPGPIEGDPAGAGGGALGTRLRVDHLVAAQFGPDGRLWVLSDDRLRETAVPPGAPAGDRPEAQWDGPVRWENDPAAARLGMAAKCLAVGRRHVLVGRRDGRLFRIDPAGPGPVTSWEVCETAIRGVALSPDETRAVVGGDRGEVRLVDLATGVVAPLPDAHRQAVPGVAFGPGLVVSGSADGRVRLWTDAGAPIAAFRLPAPVRTVHLSADGRSLLALVEAERGVRRWRLDVLFKAWADMGLADGLPPL